MTSVAIEELLVQSGMEDDARLLELLTDIEALAAGDAPAPSAEVLALMGAPAAPRSARIRSGHRQAIIITLAVVVSLATGVTAAAAAIPEVRRTAQDILTVIVHAVVPGTGAPVAPSEAPSTPHHPSTSTDAPGHSGETRSPSAPRSTTAPTAPPRATTVPANPHATNAPVAPPAQKPKSGQSPPAQSHTH